MTYTPNLYCPLKSRECNLKTKILKDTLLTKKHKGIDYILHTKKELRFVCLERLS